MGDAHCLIGPGGEVTESSDDPHARERHIEAEEPGQGPDNSWTLANLPVKPWTEDEEPAQEDIDAERSVEEEANGNKPEEGGEGGEQEEEQENGGLHVVPASVEGRALKAVLAKLASNYFAGGTTGMPRDPPEAEMTAERLKAFTKS
jgi:hypothetical protein